MERIRRRSKKNYATIFNNEINLSHGIMPLTPIDNVKKTLEIIKNFNEAK